MMTITGGASFQPMTPASKAKWEEEIIERELAALEPSLERRQSNPAAPSSKTMPPRNTIGAAGLLMELQDFENTPSPEPRPVYAPLPSSMQHIQAQQQQSQTAQIDFFGVNSPPVQASKIRFADSPEPLPEVYPPVSLSPPARILPSPAVDGDELRAFRTATAQFRAQQTELQEPDSSISSPSLDRSPDVSTFRSISMTRSESGPANAEPRYAGFEPEEPVPPEYPTLTCQEELPPVRALLEGVNSEGRNLTQEESATVLSAFYRILRIARDYEKSALSARATLYTQLSSQRARAERLTGESVRLSTDCDRLQSELRECAERSKVAQERGEQARDILTASQAEMERLSSEERLLHVRIDTIRQEYLAEQEKSSAIRAEVNQLEMSIESSGINVDGENLDVAKDKRIQDLSRQVAALSARLEETRRQLAQLDTESGIHKMNA